MFENDSKKIISRPDPWYFPRPELAENIMLPIDLQLADRTVLYGERRQGKSEHIQRDLIPLAREKGYVPCYINLWSNQKEPWDALTFGFNQVASACGASKPLTQRIKDLANSKVKSATVEVDAKLMSVEADLDLSESVGGELSDSPLSQMHRAFQHMVDSAGDTPIMLFIDEAQHLMSTKEFSATLAALRSLLDSYRDTVKVIFAGSSRKKLDEMFNDSDAAFYNSAIMFEMPKLGRDYVEFTHALAAKAAPKQFQYVSLETFIEQYENVLKGPRQLRDAIAHCIRTGKDFVAACAEIKVGIGGTVNPDIIWEGLPQEQKDIFFAVLDMHSCFRGDLYEKNIASPARIDKELEVMISHSLLGENGEGLISIDDDLLGRWVRLNVHRDLESPEPLGGHEDNLSLAEEGVLAVFQKTVAEFGLGNEPNGESLAGV